MGVDMAYLKRFWFEFSDIEEFSAIGIGCGVTAYSYNDALDILELSFPGKGLSSKILNCIHNVNVSALDKGHVLPNIGNVTVRGIWFPQGSRSVAS